MASRPVVTLYTRAGCELCDHAFAVLERLAPRLGFDVQSVDIAAIPALEERLGEAIPVVAVGRRVVAQAPIFPDALEEALREAL